MKQKITKINYFILLFTFIVELILLNISLNSNLSISIYNNIYKWININTWCITIDILFVLFILDFKNNKKMPKNIFKIYKICVNEKLRTLFYVPQIFKALVLFIFFNVVNIEFKNYANTLAIFAISTIMYYILSLVLSENENLKKKIKRLKNKDNTLSIILIDGNIKSSFDIEKTQDIIIDKNNIYIDIKRDLKKILKENNELENYILENTVAIIHEVENVDEIKNIYENEKIKKFNMYHIFATKDYDKCEEYKYQEDIKICDLDAIFEYTENLFIIRQSEIVSKRQYKKALSCLNKISKNIDDKKYNLDKSQMKNMEKIYQYNFNNRLKDKVDTVPCEKFSLALYKNAYINNSPYQSTLILFNYITVIGKLVEYYLFSKNNVNFSKDKIVNDIIGDNPPIWNNHILLNIYKSKDNILYENLREKEYSLTLEEKALIQCYLSKILNIEITGEKITFDGLMELFKNFRNKIEAHGIINDTNVYAVWNLTRFFANMLNRMFKISELECDYKTSDVKIGYKSEDKVDVGRYIIIMDKTMCFVKDKKNYINYFNGQIRPNTVFRKEENE